MRLILTLSQSVHAVFVLSVSKIDVEVLDLELLLYYIFKVGFSPHAPCYSHNHYSVLLRLQTRIGTSMSFWITPGSHPPRKYQRNGSNLLWKLYPLTSGSDSRLCVSSRLIPLRFAICASCTIILHLVRTSGCPRTAFLLNSNDRHYQLCNDLHSYLHG